MKIRVSFDIDGTLRDRQDIIDFAKIVVQKPYVDVWIVTTRYEFEDAQRVNVDNSDIYDVAEEVGIPFDNIFFTNMEWKHTFFEAEYAKGIYYLWHFDDVPMEIILLESHTKTHGFHVNQDKRFEKALQLLENWYYSYLV